MDGLANPEAVVVSPDGKQVYVTSDGDDALVAFREARCGDGFADVGEQCDDGNDIDDDCCRTTCEANAGPCDDGAFCTVDDACRGGTCQGRPRDCSMVATDLCFEGMCDEETDSCASRVRPDGSACEDGDLCTRPDTCLAGRCGSGTPVACPAPDTCHDAGVCDPATGLCSTPTRPEHTGCDDGDACTTVDTCLAGVCTGTSEVICVAQDQCHDPGTCDPRTGFCSNPVTPDGVTCDDGDACTPSDTCVAGACTGGAPVVCSPSDQCHDASCSSDSGRCETRAKADGTACDDGDPGTEDDVCTDGTCRGTLLVDGDGDGIVDAIDLCPRVPDPEQSDADGNGVGDACECTAPAPGRCLAGGGPAATDCLLEFNPSGPVTLDRRRVRVKDLLQCTDGDPSCDRDALADGRCTFGVAICLANADPRLRACRPVEMVSFEVLGPDLERAKSPSDRANAVGLERTAAAMGLEIRRRGRPVVAGVSGTSNGGCSSLASVVVPAPDRGGRPVRRTLRARVRAYDGRSDRDRITLECR